MLSIPKLYFLLLGAFCALLSSSPVSAQLSGGPQPCSNQNEQSSQAQPQTPYPKIVLEGLSFDTPTHLSEPELRELAASLHGHEFAADSNWINKLQEEIVGAWQDHGYFKVAVKADPQLLGSDSSQQRFWLKVHVEEGLQYWLGDIRFTLNPNPGGPTLRRKGGRLDEFPDTGKVPAFPPEELRKLIPSQRGEIFNVAKIREGLEAMRKLYGSRGYINFAANPLTEVDDDHQRISLVIQLDEQPQHRIGKVEVLGLDPATESFLRSELKPGEVFTLELYNGALKGLSSRLSDDVSPAGIEIRRNVQDSTVDLIFDLRTCPKPES